MVPLLLRIFYRPAKERPNCPFRTRSLKLVWKPVKLDLRLFSIVIVVLKNINHLNPCKQKFCHLLFGSSVCFH